MGARWMLLVCCLVLAAPPVSFAQEGGLLGSWRQRAAGQELEGTWRATLGGAEVELVLRGDGTFQLDGLSGTYEVEQGELAFSNGVEIRYAWQLAGDELRLTGGDLHEPLELVRAQREGGYLTWVFDTTLDAIWQRLHRILILVGIVVVARLLIWMLGGISALLVFSSWGPLGLLYRNNKNRAKTIHSLVLNVVKYFIYFTALGMILGELGVNYGTYIASLSVIGLAIGFGSQGLVQDMVTGFFIIFEGQFDVGDMVEISGQSGYVTEIGLRMTKLRNYLGQVIVIPNRNIATVANYSRGAQRAYVDVALAGEQDAERALHVLRTLGGEMQKQYDGVLLQPVRVSGPTKLKTGELFVRLHFSLWPNQTWVVDQQLVPRIRERFGAEGLEIPSDRVAAFYHARQLIAVPRWRQRMSWLQRRSAAGAPGPAPRSSDPRP